MRSKLYDELADWWPLLSPPSEYAEEATFYRQALLEAAEGEVRSVLELGSGGGNNASHLKQYFQLTLVDLSSGMLAVSQALNPECDHVRGDMRTVRLPRLFDAVFVHDAIAYMTSEDDVRRVLGTAYMHLRPGGAAPFASDHLRENFRVGTDHGGHDGIQRGLRYLAWTWDPDPMDATYTVDYAFMLREEDGSVRVEHDRHVEGLFSREFWLRSLEDVGFEARVLPFDHSELEPGEYEVFVGRRR